MSGRLNAADTTSAGSTPRIGCRPLTYTPGDNDGGGPTCRWGDAPAAVAALPEVVEDWGVSTAMSWGRSLAFEAALAPPVEDEP